MQHLTLRNILLKKLDRILNPELSKWIVRTLVATGGACLGYGVSSRLLEISIPFRWGKIVISFGNDNAILLIFIGLLLILLGVYVYKQWVPLPSNNAAATVRQLMATLAADIANQNFSYAEKLQIFMNGKREIDTHLVSSGLTELEVPTFDVARDNIEGRFRDYQLAVLGSLEKCK